MEKTKAWSLIIVSSFFILLFSLALLILTPDLFKHGIAKRDSYISIFAILVILTLLVLVLIYGIKKLKLTKSVSLTEYNKALDLNFTGKINFKDYRNLILSLSFKRPVLLFYIGVIFLLIMNLINVKNNPDNFPTIIIGLFIGLLFVPGVILYQTKRIYNTNKIFHELVNYSLNNDVIKIKGETFESELRWSHFYKIKETKDFFILFNGKTIGTLIQKKLMSDLEINEFRKFTLSLPILKS